jgi:hypothetical protein
MRTVVSPAASSAGLANAHAGEARILIHRILDEGCAAGREIGAKLVPCDVEQRSNELNAVIAGQRIGRAGPHGRQPVHAAAAPEAQQKRFGLIIARVRDEDCGDTVCTAPVTDQAIARVASTVFDIGSRSLTAPAQGVSGKTDVLGPIGGGRSLFGRARAQTMVDREHEAAIERALARAQPIGGEMHQGDRIATTGDGESKGRAQWRAKPFECSGKADAERAAVSGTWRHGARCGRAS